MEYTTVPTEVLHGLCKPNVHQHCPVEGVVICLVDDVDPVVKILPTKERMNMPEEHGQLATSVSVRNYYCHIVSRAALVWAGLSSREDGWVFLQD